MAHAKEFVYEPKTWKVTHQMKEAFDQDGYVLVRNLFTPEEIRKVRTAVNDSKGIMRYAFGRHDGISRSTMQCIWNHPGHDITGVVPRLDRVAGTMEQLMGGDELYHYHSKVTMKDAHTGGAFAWHQDYGYWYKNGNLYPDMATVFMPIDDSTRENGCLQVLKGSHRMGRLDHVDVGQQLGADPARVEEVKKVLDHQYVEMKAGDALFFHCCLLHTSAQNSSPNRRWVFISCFNKRSNNPYKEHHHPQYTPMEKLPNSTLMQCDVTENLEEKWFMEVEKDHSVKKRNNFFIKAQQTTFDSLDVPNTFCIMIKAKEFEYVLKKWDITQSMKEAFDEDGYVLIRNLFTPEEIAKVKTTVNNSKGIMNNTYERDDGMGKKAVMTIWNHPGHDLCGVVPRLNRVAGTMEQLMGGDEMYHYHTKLSMKNAYEGGAFIWHQDYGYWYKNGNLFPDLASVFLPLDDSTRENGCLQVLKGSHRMGRLDHVELGLHLGADPDRVEEIKKVLEHQYIEMKAGDGLFFHCCLLHASSQNSSPNRRWAMIPCFNKRSNNPYMEHHHPQYTPMTKLPDSTLMECDVTENLEGKWFMKIDKDYSVPSKLKT